MNSLRSLVLDTNVVLDLWVFEDGGARPLREALAARQVRWLATQSMRDELQRVLAYEQLVPWLQRRGVEADAVLQAFDAHVALQPPPPRAAVSCRDPDDQKFIDLALAHRALLVSRDKAVLAMRRPLRLQGADVQGAWPGPISVPRAAPATGP